MTETDVLESGIRRKSELASHNLRNEHFSRAAGARQGAVLYLRGSTLQLAALLKSQGSRYGHQFSSKAPDHGLAHGHGW